MFFRELETDRLFLKNISSDDRDFIFSQFSNDEVNRYLFDAEPLISEQGADEIIDFYIQPEPRGQHRWIIVNKNNGVKLGTCGFHCWDKAQNICEVGYDLYPDFWGNGYMVEAMQAVLTFARIDMKIKQINACIYIDNDKSFSLVEKLGFVFNGKMKEEVFHDKKYHHKIFTLIFPE